MLSLSHTKHAAAALIVALAASSLAPFASAETVAQTTLRLIFPQVTGAAAIDPGTTLGSYLIAYFSRLESKVYSEQDARRYAISLGLIDKDASMGQPLDSALLRIMSYRHRILFTDDPVATAFGSVDINGHITLANYKTLKVVNDHIHYYEEKLKDPTLPVRLAETLEFRKLRFDALKKQLSVSKNGAALSVPFFKQERSLSCEMASLHSFLVFYGHDVKEADLIAQLGIALPLEFANGIWGDPNEAFVGKINASQNNMTGYGTYWRAVARVAKLYEPSANWFEGGSLEDITRSLDGGNPVIVWTVVPAVGGFKELHWKTPDGKDITGYNGEHTWVVDGYTGTTEKPMAFHVVDPYYGPRSVTVAELTKQWARFNNSGVILQ